MISKDIKVSLIDLSCKEQTFNHENLFSLAAKIQVLQRKCTRKYQGEG